MSEVFSLPHLIILISVFSLMMAIVGFMPQIIAFYRERLRLNMLQTTRELNRFFIDIKPTKILIGAILLGALVGYLSGSWVFALAIGAGGLVAPRFILAIWRDMRSAQFDKQLVDALILMGNALKSGLDMTAGLELVSTNMKAPISEEFGLVLNSYKLGTPLERALLELTDRIKSRNLETAVYSINIQRESGGNIIKTFDQLIMTIREESKLQKKVNALTSQGRMQIFFLAGFPWGLALVFLFLAPDMMLPALRHPMGQLVLVFLLVWEGIGLLVTKKIVQVDI